MADITRNITLQQGAPVSILFIAKLTVEGSPIDLTDKTLTASLRRASTAYTDYEFTINVTDAVNGEFYIEMTDEYLNTIPASRCIYEIHMDDAGTDTRLYTGLSIVLAEGVTNTSPDNYASNQQNTFKDVSDGYFVKWEDNLIIDASVGEFELILPDNPTKGFLFDFIDKGNTFSSLTPVTLRNSTDVIDSVEISGYYTFVWSGNIWASYRGQDSSSVAGVTSVAGRGGDVVLTSTDVGLSNVDNTSDANKPVSTAQAAADGVVLASANTYTDDKITANIVDGDTTHSPSSDAVFDALAAKESTITATTSADYYRGDKTFQTLNKAAVGLSNVDNTSDANKPVSTAQATADGVVLTAAQIYTSNPSNITQDSTHRFATDVEKTTWNAKQNALGYTPENVTNKQTDLTASATKYPTVNAVNTGLSTNLSAAQSYADGKLTATITNGDTTHAPTGDAVFDALATKESIITATTSADYYRGDKTFQPLNKAAVGLSNVDNTSDANKPVSTAQATADGVVLSSAQSYADGKVIDSIADSDTTHAPSRNAVFDALALKLDTSATTANVPDSLNKRYVTDAQLTTLGNTTNINSGDQNLFSTIVVAGQSNVVADNTSDTLTLVAGSNITITTNAATDEITISSTGGGGGSLTTFKDDIDFGNNKYSAEVSVADATATIDDSLLLTLVNGSTMSAEEAVIQEITLACTTVVGVGYTITAYAPLGADGIISFVGLKVGT